MAPRLLSLADGALLVEVGDAISPALLERVSALDAAVRAEAEAGRLPGVVETVPTYRSLAILYDPLVTTRAALERAVVPLLDAPAAPVARQARTWRLPVRYGGEHGPDLDGVARVCGLAPEEVAALHAGTSYVVYVLGFLPGFAYLGDVPEAIRVPRRTDPRTRVPAGSVAVADRQTAVYPWESPGGWQLLGRCPVPLFDARRSPPALLAPSDRVAFEPVSLERYREIEADLAAGRLAPEELAER